VNSSLELIDTGVVYINPNPGYRYTFASHSHVVQLGPRELLCMFQRGQALYSVDSVIAYARSVDGGKTWSTEGLVHDPAGEERPFSYHGPMQTRIDDGTIVVNAIRWDRSDPSKPIFNEDTGGILSADSLLYRSTDNGATWSGPGVIEPPEGMVITPASAIVVLADGRWFLPFDRWHAYDEPGPFRPRTVGLLSSDEGQTWGDPISFGDNPAPGVFHWHGRIIRLRDDRLYALMWTANLATGESMPLHFVVGSADAREWSTPEATNIPGQTNGSVDLGDGRMAAIFTVREGGSPGFYVALSEDGGRTWDLENQLHTWDATARDKLGISSPDKYPRSHDTIAFGAPTAMLLDDGDIFCTFWCTEAAVTHIRYVRLGVV
jgi:hypothetical protein